MSNGTLRDAELFWNARLPILYNHAAGVRVVFDFVDHNEGFGGVAQFHDDLLLFPVDLIWWTRQDHPYQLLLLKYPNLSTQTDKQSYKVQSHEGSCCFTAINEQCLSNKRTLT